MPTSIISIVFHFLSLPKEFETPNWLVSNWWQKKNKKEVSQISSGFSSSLDVTFKDKLHPSRATCKKGMDEREEYLPGRENERKTKRLQRLSKSSCSGIWTRWSKDTWNTELIKQREERESTPLQTVYGTPRAIFIHHWTFPYGPMTLRCSRV
jgi:hypothetical protein